MKFFTENIAGIILFIATASLPAMAHDSWLDVPNAATDKTGSLEARIMSGHAFPGSEFALESRTINYLKVIAPDGKATPLSTEENGSFRTGKITIKQKGTYILLGGLKNPPRYFMKSLLTVGESGKCNLRAGETCEIVPEQNPFDLKIGDKMKIKFFHEGKAAPASLSVSIGGKNNFSASTDNKGEYEFTVKKKGKYLIISSINGKTASLTFEIK